MNFFGNDLMKGVINAMSNNNGWNNGNEKENALRNSLEYCTYPDETKWTIEKAVKQLFHVYPFFIPDILKFTENGQPRRYIELKGILEIDIKNKTCKVDFNMMLPFDYPRSPPFVRIVNRNPEYTVDPFYIPLKSKTDPSSFVLNDKLGAVKMWQPSSSLVNVVIECYDLFKNKFPFSKPVAEYSGNGSAWDSLYNSKKQPTNNNQNGKFLGNYGNNNNNNNGWNNNANNGWGGNNNNNGWGQPSNNNGWNNNSNNNGWGATNNNNSWGSNNNNNAWNTGANNQWGNNNPPANNWGSNNNSWGSGSVGGMGGMGGINSGANITSAIASAQKLVGKQKQTLQQMNGSYLKVLQKLQVLDVTKQSLESEESYLRTENFEMANFLKQNESSSEAMSITTIVQPKDAISEQILDLMSGIKAREECVLLLENKFNQEEISLEEFMKLLRKIQEAKFQEKILLQKCIKKAAI